MKEYILIILIGLVSAFVGIIPLLKRRADSTSVLSCFILFLMMPYIVLHFNLKIGYWWMKGMIISSALSLPLIIALTRGNLKFFFHLFLFAILIGAFITFVSYYLL